MIELPPEIAAFLTAERLLGIVKAAVLLLLGLLLARGAAAGVARLAQPRASAQQRMLLKRITYYGVLGLFAVSALRALGFDLGILLGAAGVLTVALGFASQTSASNLISGLFLLGERPFVVGDVISVSGHTGEVVSLDLLSVKLRTFDNLSVRIPNETLLKSEIVTLTRYPIRRVDLKLRVGLEADLGAARDALLAAAEADPLVFDEPKPVLMILGFGESGVDLQFAVWTRRESFVEVRTAMYRAAQEHLAAAGVPIPAPVRVLRGPEGPEGSEPPPGARGHAGSRAEGP